LRAHDDSTRVSALGSRARLALDAGDATAARGFVMPAIDLIESERARIDEPQLRTGYFASQRAYYELAIEVLMQLHAQFPIAGHDVEALEMAERARARALRDELATRAAPSTDAPPAVIAAERVAADALRTAAWQSAQVAATDAATSRRLQVEVDAASRRLDEARGKLRAADPRYAALLHPQPFRLSEARRAWLGDAVVFEYWLGAKRSYLWRIARDDVRIWTLPSRERIEAEVDALRTALLPGDLTTMSFVQRVEAERRADAVLGAQARSLSAELLPPGSAAPESVDIAIVADGELQRTPFALFFARPLVYLPSLAVLRELRASGPRRGRDAIAIFADPIFGADDPRIAASKPQAAAPGQPAWRRLAHTGDEVAALAAAFPDVPQQVATGAAASRAAALDMSWSDYRIVHFATHAAIDLRHPELSGVVLSLYDAQGNPQDGMLRMSDVYDLHMPVDLVVLGVCDATRERGRGAEGMFGLSRAFFHAGARRLLVSLWPVDDAASSLLFASFYRHLAVAGTSPQEALQRAQTDMQAEPRWRSPFYWAGFVVHGDWR
jgi:CHAT domain-containing protein